MHLVAEDTFERLGQFAGKVLEQLREVRLQPRDRMIAATDKKQEQMRMRRDAACSENAQGFAEAGRAFAGTNAAQGIIMNLRITRDVPTSSAAGLERGRSEERRGGKEGVGSGR